MYYIYRITNLVNGKTYIGQHRYKKLNDSYMGSGKLLKPAFNKYGIENFTKTIIHHSIETLEMANNLEKYWISYERLCGKAEYNIANGGQGHTVEHHSEETKQKMREAAKGKIGYWKGKKMSEEHKLKLAEAKKGKKHSEEWNRKMRESLKGHKGASYKHTEESKLKIAKARKGKPSNTKGKRWKLVDGKRFYY